MRKGGVAIVGLVLTAMLGAHTAQAQALDYAAAWQRLQIGRAHV